MCIDLAMTFTMLVKYYKSQLNVSLTYHGVHDVGVYNKEAEYCLKYVYDFLRFGLIQKPHQCTVYGRTTQPIATV